MYVVRAPTRPLAPEPLWLTSDDPSTDISIGVTVATMDLSEILQLTNQRCIMFVAQCGQITNYCARKLDQYARLLQARKLSHADTQIVLLRQINLTIFLIDILLKIFLCYKRVYLNEGNKF